jgi:hypothetical protein
LSFASLLFSYTAFSAYTQQNKPGSALMHAAAASVDPAAAHLSLFAVGLLQCQAGHAPSGFDALTQAAQVTQQPLPVSVPFSRTFSLLSCVLR